ncbi:MAG: ribonuclease HIII [Lentisphaeria bacterium]|nr:ribonuclease HIII [Lentisphaeria bacterium]
MEKTSRNHVYELTEPETAALRTLLEERGWELTDAPYMVFRARKEKTTVCVYTSGKLVAQGKGADEFVEFLLEPEILREKMFALNTEDTANAGPSAPAEPFAPHAGMDESGKGDFFGPLVVAAVYVPDEAAAEELRQYGVKDSKQIKNDRTILAIAGKIRALLGDGMGVVTIGPEAYNRLYGQFPSLNHLLAWGHARALENLLNNVPQCTAALADKFGNELLILRALNEKGRKIRLDQRTKAESDVAVAAASIMARAQFVRIMEKLGGEIGTVLPKGAGRNVDETAAALFEKGGRELLEKVAKMHFRNAYKAMGLPMPERKPWHPGKR